MNRLTRSLVRSLPHLKKLPQRELPGVLRYRHKRSSQSPALLARAPHVNLLVQDVLPRRNSRRCCRVATAATAANTTTATSRFQCWVGASAIDAWNGKRQFNLQNSRSIFANNVQNQHSKIKSPKSSFNTTFQYQFPFFTKSTSTFTFHFYFSTSKFQKSIFQNIFLRTNHCSALI